jgi:hypothetical protein
MHTMKYEVLSFCGWTAHVTYVQVHPLPTRVGNLVASPLSSHLHSPFVKLVSLFLCFASSAFFFFLSLLCCTFVRVCSLHIQTCQLC